MRPAPSSLFRTLSHKMNFVAVIASLAVIATNTFTHGKLSVTKSATGAGAGDFGNETFTVDAVCTYNGSQVYTGSVDIKKNETGVFQQGSSGVLLPNGTVCYLTESKTGGANGTNVVPQGTAGAQGFINIELLRENGFAVTAFGIIRAQTAKL